MKEDETRMPLKKKHRADVSPFRSSFFSVAGSLLSGLLLALSFPGFGHASLAFIGLVPLMFAVRSASVGKAAVFGLLSGFVFFMLSLEWLTNLTGMVAGAALKASALSGYIVLALYCGLYFIPFAITVAVSVKRWGMGAFRKNMRLMFGATMIWIASEYLRSILFTGFPWNALGISQYTSPVLIQVAEWGGVYVVSAVIVWMNVGLFITLHQYIHGIRLRSYRPHGELMLGFLPLARTVAYGLHVVLSPPIPESSIQVALIQPNIGQAEKWDRRKKRQIRTALEELTTAAARIKGTDMIIWPETALPDEIRTCTDCRDLVLRMVQQGPPLLIGSLDFDQTVLGRTYYNSSILIGTNGVEIGRYDKQHLVPFGEYVPFPNLMSGFTPVNVDITPGRESTLLSLRNSAPFSVLICFEDTVAKLSVQAVRSGARWLVNQTNDAWFDPGAQSEQHLAHAVFRCVENRVPMVRCCNTGISCTIDAYGYVERSLKPLTGGFAVGHVQPRSDDRDDTFYTRHGDAFAGFSLFAGCVVIFVLGYRGKRSSRTEA